MEKIKAELIAKMPYTTWCLKLIYPENSIPTELLKELEDHGWKKYGQIPPVKGEMETFYSKDGTDLFNGWTEKERKIDLREIRTILRKNGLINIPKIKLTLQDLL